jgi:hypothetical protein
MILLDIFPRKRKELLLLNITFVPLFEVASCNRSNRSNGKGGRYYGDGLLT